VYSARTYNVKQSLDLKDDLAGTTFLNAFALAAQIESQLISQRTKAGLAAAKAKGVKLGKPKLKQDNRIRRRNARRFAKSLSGVIEPMVKENLSRQEACDRLNASGVKARRGGQWHLTSLNKVLKLLDL
jgi:putative DNA-invertase from lambdoid prophage Rac